MSAKRAERKIEEERKREREPLTYTTYTCTHYPRRLAIIRLTFSLEFIDFSVFRGSFLAASEKIERERERGGGGESALNFPTSRRVYIDPQAQVYVGRGHHSRLLEKQATNQPSARVL